MFEKHLVRNYVISGTAALCTIQHGYDTSLFSSVQIIPAWKLYFHTPKPALIGAVTTAYSVASVVFAMFVSSSLSDWFGRKWTAYIGSFIVIVGALIMSFAPTIGGFIAGRFLVGAGLGLSTPAGPVYIEELVYARIRGRLLSFWQMCYGVGQMLAAFVAYGCIFSPSLGDWQWRIVTLLQIFPPILLIVCLAFCPETPRWYAQKGKFDKAREVLATVRLPEEVDHELLEIQEAINYEKESKQNNVKQLFCNRSYRNRLILGMALNFGQLAGINSLATYGGLIFKQVFASNRTALLLNGITATLLIPYCLTATFFLDRWGRRPMLIFGAVGMGLTMMVVATLVTQYPRVDGMVLGSHWGT